MKITSQRGNVIKLTDIGPPAARQHGEFVVEERSAAEGRAKRTRKVTPLETLFNRGLITKNEWVAGTRLAETWFAAGYESPVTVNLFGVRGEPRDYTPKQLAARRDFDLAMSDLGPLKSTAYDICCEEMTIRSIEGAMGWRRGAGLIVIKIALKALASHYGYEVPKKPVT
tara:strand:+ start:848 stop:1357 length:510 start_codon:yes stop_codon:yes gene_type:complete